MALTSSNTSSTLSRYRLAIIALTLIGAAAGTYYIYESYLSLEDAPREQPLRRRNAMHRQVGRRRGGEHDRQAHEHPDGNDTPSRAEALQRYSAASGSYIAQTSRRGNFSVPLTPALLQNTAEFRRQHGLSEPDALQARYDLEEASLDAYLQGDDAMVDVEIPNGQGQVWDELMALGFLPESAGAAIARYNSRLRDRNNGGYNSEGREQPHEEGEQTSNGLDGRETVVDGNSEFSWRGEHENEAPKEGQSLLNLLYHIAEDQARREGYVHRGVTCNSCGSMPIRGIRYRCANCVDYDLCETCEPMQVHPKTHLFYKVRIPAPFLGNPRQAQPVWYPGKPSSLPQNLSREFARRLSRDTGFDNAELEALWDQFRCLAATEWVDDPNKLNMAVDRRTFDRCFVPNTSIRPPPPNLIYDRMFSFYDTNGDGLIGFEEFLKGLASLINKSKDERLKRVFQGYDIDGDGYVDRKDFLRMFRAFYALSKELTRDMVASMEEDVTEHNAAKEIVLSSQPISSAFSGLIPPGERSRTGEGKRRDVNGDDAVIDNQPSLRESGDDTGDTNDVVADAAERRAFGYVRSETERKPWDSMFGGMEVGERTEGESGEPQSALRDRHTTRSDSWVTATDGEQEQPHGVANDPRWTSTGQDWPPNYIQLDDVEAALGTVIPLEDVLDEDRVKVRAAALLRLQGEDRSKHEEIRQKAVQDRWRRRAFYLDEEDGGVPPEDFDDIGDQDEDNQGPGSDQHSSASHSYSPARRSRSSSKVRFQDDVTDVDYETRSNGSVSSRNIPVGERWGGYAIPEAEKDVGKEVLYQVTQQGLNEMLDPLFKAKEDLAMEALMTRGERKKWRKEISQWVERSQNRNKKTARQKSQPSTAEDNSASPSPLDETSAEVFDALEANSETQPSAQFRDDAKCYIKNVQRCLQGYPVAYMHFLEVIMAFKLDL